MKPELSRQPHASLDESSRIGKAKKIAYLLATECKIPGSRVLEVGTGSGFIAAHFASLVGPRGHVHAVDLADQRQTTEGFDFDLVTDTTLPFEDKSFDICISNHVIEHVGEKPAQEHHLREIKRVLRPDGWLYLAAPNRWTPIEPHFRLPFLSWLPHPLRDVYVRALGRGTLYDCEPLSHSETAGLLAKSGYASREVSIEGIKAVGTLECNPGLRRWLFSRPHLWALPFRPILPSFIFLARPE
jgi:SAM-dependent methyltransferase